MTDKPTPADGFTDGHLTDEAFAEVAGTAYSADESAQTVAMASHYESHLAQCAHCRAELEATERVIAALQAPVSLQQPPPSLWDHISAGLENDDGATIAHPEFSRGGSTPGSAPDPARRGADGGEDEPAPVHQLDQHRDQQRQNRRAPWWGVFAAAAAGAVIGGAAIAGILGQDTEEQEPPAAGSPVGGATLEPVEADEFSGQAEMVAMEDGSMELTLEIVSAPDPAEGYFEVWLRDEEANQLISLGAVTADSTTLQVPAGIDLSQYPVVDVSHEHFDGDPGHSGITLAAGPMEGEED